MTRAGHPFSRNGGLKPDPACPLSGGKHAQGSYLLQVPIGKLSVSTGAGMAHPKCITKVSN